MRFFYLLLTFTFLLNINAYSQNMVKNPDFEELVFGPFFQCKDWRIFGTVDLFAPYDAFFKQNNASAPYKKEEGEKYQLEHYVYINNNIKAQNGENFIGIYLSCFPTTKYSPDIGMEHIQGGLISPLINGKTYKVSFWYRFAHRVSNAYGMNLGVFFSKNPEFVKCLGFRAIVKNSVYPQISYLDCFNNSFDAQVSTPKNEFIKDTVWTKFEGSFIAQGEEQYLTIGFFWQDQPEVVKALENLKNKPSKSKKKKFIAITKKYLSQDSPYQVTGYPPKEHFPKGMKYSYMLIDNVLVIPLDSVK